jgi:hypothetical protein
MSVMVRNKDTTSLKSSLIEYYCDTWLQTHAKAKDDVPDMQNWCVDSDNMRFDPRQSLFMYGLCVGYEESYTGKKSTLSLKQDDFLERGRKEIFQGLSYTLENDGE